MANDNTMEDATQTFAALAVICDSMARLFAAPPDKAMVEVLREIDSEDTLCLNSEDPDWGAGLHLVAGYCKREGIEQCVLDATGDHSRLFVGPTHVLAPPWSSVYLDDGRLSGPTAQRVAQLFRQHGLQVPKPGQEPADHISYELEFVGELSRRIQASIQAGDCEAARGTAKTLREFCDDSLLPWLEPFLGRVEEHAETDYYRGLAKITRSLVALELGFVVHLSEWLYSTPGEQGSRQA